jgi:hypothetical protein
MPFLKSWDYSHNILTICMSKDQMIIPQKMVLNIVGHKVIAWTKKPIPTLRGGRIWINTYPYVMELLLLPK